MILFYNKETGDIFSVMDGRVHNERHLQVSVRSSNIPDELIGKYIIGWIESENGKIEYNMDKFELLQKFEDNTPENPLDYRIDIENNNLIKK